jgi:hypothetical protein
MAPQAFVPEFMTRSRQLLSAHECEDKDAEERKPVNGVNGRR